MGGNSESKGVRAEGLLNAATHGVGTGLAGIGLFLMLWYYWQAGIWHLASCLIYGGSLILLYLASTLYHSFREGRSKRAMRFMDHAAIYVVIAGSYTPFLLIPLHGEFGWTVFLGVWLLAAAGIVFQLFCVGRFRVLGTLCYLFMGWLALVMVPALQQVLPAAALCWLVTGGLLYTLGSIFYLCRRIPFNHAIWHLFVLGGSGAHFVAIFAFVLPLPETVQAMAMF